MTINPFAAEVAAERRRALLHEADDYRRARTTRMARRPARVSRLTLRISCDRP